MACFSRSDVGMGWGVSNLKRIVKINELNFLLNCVILLKLFVVIYNL